MSSQSNQYSLEKWLENACEIVYGEESYDIVTLTLEGRIISVGAAILGLSPRSELSAICNGLSTHVHRRLDKNCSLMMLIECLLVVAVGEENKERSMYVSGIMTLEPSVQADLMRVIQNNLQYSQLEETVDNSDKALTSSSSSSSSSSISSPIYSDSPSNKGTQMIAKKQTIIDTTQKCMECTNLERMVESLRQDARSAQQTAKDTNTKLKADIAAQSNKLVEAELNICEKEKEIVRQEIDIANLKSEIKSLEEDLSQSAVMKDQLSELRDRVDILQPDADRAAKNDVKIEKLRERLDELLPLREQLTKETDAHRETYSRLLKLEGEMKDYEKCRLQVEEYKEQCAEASIKIDDLTSQLKEHENQLREASTNYSNLTNRQAGHMQQTNFLKTELEATKEELNSLGRREGIGMSISELNPVLMMEMDRLRNENQELQQRLLSASVDEVEKLSNRLADEITKSTSLHKKWTDTKNLLTIMKLKLEQMTTMKTQLEITMMDMSIKHRERHAMLTADFEGNKVKWDDKVTFHIKQHNDATTLSRVGKRALVTSYEADVNNLQAQLKDTGESLSDMTNNYNTTSTNLTKMTSDFDAYKTESMYKMDELNAILDEERVKRRRVEREKKVFENTSSRTRVNGSAINVDMDSLDAAREEMKNMQHQLDVANMKIRDLEAGGSSGSSNGSSSSGSGLAERKTRSSTVSTRRTRSGTGAVRVRTTAESQSYTDITDNSNGDYLSSGDMVSGSGSASDRRLDQLLREKREWIATKLQEDKEKMEISQKLLAKEKEVTNLKSQNTKLTLERERWERKFTKATQSLNINHENENIINQ